MIGTPSEVDKSFITDQSALDYLSKFKPRPATNLRKRFTRITDSGLNLLSMMLQFNPFIRLTVEQCLDHPYFDSIRDSEYSFESPVVLDFPFENIKQLSSQNIRAEMAKLVKKKKCRSQSK